MNWVSEDGTHVCMGHERWLVVWPGICCCIGFVLCVYYSGYELASLKSLERRGSDWARGARFGRCRFRVSYYYYFCGFVIRMQRSKLFLLLSFSAFPDSCRYRFSAGIWRNADDPEHTQLKAVYILPFSPPLCFLPFADASAVLLTWAVPFGCVGTWAVGHQSGFVD